MSGLLAIKAALFTQEHLPSRLSISQAVPGKGCNQQGWCTQLACSMTYDVIIMHLTKHMWRRLAHAITHIHSPLSAGSCISTYTPALSPLFCMSWSAGTNRSLPAQTRMTHHECASQADIYSFGVVLWELLTGEQPRRGQITPLQ